MVELKLYRWLKQARRSGVSGKSRNRTLHHRVAVRCRRGDHLARSVNDEGSAVRARSLTLQQGNESIFLLGIHRRE
jgi:hypothetical protein